MSATQRDYSRSYSAGSSAPNRGEVDPSGKSREKDDMVVLNDKFVRLIDKVKHLEDENRKLDAKRRVLKQHVAYGGKVDEAVAWLERQLGQRVEALLADGERLRAELLGRQAEVEEARRRYEDELLRKADLENEFVLSRKDVDEGHLNAVHLVLELEDLIGRMDFLRVGYDEEIKEMESLIQNETVVLCDDSKRSLDMDEIVESAKSQYANMAARTREDAEYWNKRKMDVTAFNEEREVRDLRREMSDTARHIQKLNGNLEALLRKDETLEKDIAEARAEGDVSLEDARAEVAQLEEALRRAKQDLIGQIREYQELMNLKLALDVEIATYRQLLEGEEQRMNDLMVHADA